LSTKSKRAKPRPVLKKAAREAPEHPTGKVPEAMVLARHGTEMVTRSGRGFSPEEISKVGIDPRLASKWGVRIDARRRSVLEGNVAMLKRWGGHLAQSKKTEGRVKKVEEELEKVEEEVEKEAAKVEREVVKVEKEVKKEAARAEKAVKAKVERPRAKPKKKKTE
jgi:ribosomal protein L13E